MRLTADLINSSLSYLNPLKERELDLRGHKIPAIENLGVAKDHDALDLTDNDIAALTNLPLMPRLRTILLARNRVASISPTLGRTVPHVTTIVLEGNRLSELADLDPLGTLPQLTHLVLVGSPVCRRENYRHWVLYRCPALRFLDYVKIKQAERERARELFGTSEEPTELANKVGNVKSRTFDVGSAGAGASSSNGDKVSRVQLNAKERARVEKMLRNAKSLAEIARLEKELNEGRVPGGIIEDEMDES